MINFLGEDYHMSDIFEGIGNIFGGIAKSVVPKDTPEGKILAAQSDLSDFEKQETELLLEIGREAYNGNPAAWQQDSRIQLVRQNISIAQVNLEQAKLELEQLEAAQRAEDEKGRCPNCSHKNPEGFSFCQECGTPLAPPAPVKAFCTSCGAEIAPGTRFCGICGAKQGEL